MERRRRRRIRRTGARVRRCYSRPVISALVLGWAACLNSLAWAQTNGTTCATAPITTAIRVEDAAGVATLRSEASCINRGSLQAEWAGAAVPIDSPIAIASGTSLTVTGDDALAEAQGGSSQTRLFEVSPGGSLTLTQLKLSGGAAGNGGAIYSDSASLMLNNCTFEGNTATDGDGGAVWADGGSVTIVGGKFLSNNATLNGGAVLATDAILVVREGTRFESNRAVEGGALYCGAAGLGLSTGSGPSCSITNAEFVSNNASLETFLDLTIVGPWEDLNGGGAAAFWFTEADITDSVFTSNYAQFTGGAVFGGNDTDITVQGCSFALNTAKGYGGAVGASSMTLGGDTQLVDNKATIYHGGAVFGWNATGAIEFNDVLCRNNTAPENGGCFYGAGESLINDGTVMLDNVGHLGGCIYASSTCDMEVAGGTFTCQCSKNGAFMFATDGARVNITGGLIENNVATRRAGAVYCSGDSFDLGGSKVTIEGGVFRNNSALELGGAIVAWGTTSGGLNPTVVTITGGEFINNTAKFYGGFIFLEEKASINCKGANISGNYAGDQGGGIYGREAKWVNSSCDLTANESPQGAAIYLTNVRGANLENHEIAANLASGGSVVYVAASSVVAKGVMFKSGVGLQEDSSNRAIQLDGDSSLNADECVFDGWSGDTVVYHRNSAPGSLVLDSCDFTRSAATTAVTSPHSDAEIRNAVVSSLTFENAAGTLNNSLALVDRALDCSDPNACGAGKCGNSTLGVLCECLEGGECLDGGGELSLRLESNPDAMTFYPDPVSYKLVVSSASTGTTNAIWALHFHSVDLILDVVPSSGVLPPGSSVTVTVSGTPSTRDVGGNLISSFNVTSVASASSDATGNAHLNVNSSFYLCPAYEYADPVVGDDEGFSCEPCASIGEAEGVDCDGPGATLASLPIREGYWRPSPESLNVRACLHEEACVGATAVSTSDDYCEDGYRGPYCAVCQDGYGRGVSNACHYCNNTKAHLLITMGSLFAVVVLVLLALAVVFLIGGLDAIDIVKESFSRNFSFVSKASAPFPPGPGPSLERGSVTEMVSMDATVAPAYDIASEAKGDDAGSGVRRGRVFPTDYSETDDDQLFPLPLGSDVGVGAGTNPFHPADRPVAGDAGRLAGRPARPSAVAGVGTGVTGARLNRGVGVEVGGGGKAKCCGLGEKIKRVMALLPLNKLKILVVVWQILAVFSGITGVEFPASYSTFLSWISVVNLDIGSIFSASCILPAINFYLSLLATTLGPLVLTGVLVLTYHMAKGRAGIGSAGVIARRAAWSRHVAAGLLLTFLVFTSTSTVVFKTFACDQVEGKNFLRADYSISCDTGLHLFFEIYSGFMIVIYPIGIPVLYAVILWTNRELLNPSIVRCKPESDSADESTTDSTAVLCTSSKGQVRHSFSPEELQELEERVQARKGHPALVPSMFLWKDFGPDLYYYEVIECGRRMLLTGVLIFIAPQSATQAAMACIFAFASLLGFELLRPHMDPSDSWLYRLGCVVIFLSNFLALLIKVDVGGDDNRAAFGVLLIAVNVMLVLAVLLTSWFAVQQSVDDHRDDDNAFNLAKTMLTAEQDTAKHARSARERVSAKSLAPAMESLDSPQPSSSATSWRHSASFRELQAAGGGANVAGMPILTHDASMSSDTAEIAWLQDNGNARLPVAR